LHGFPSGIDVAIRTLNGTRQRTLNNGRRPAMKLTTALSAGVVVATMTVSVAVAGITDRLQSDRMTVLNVDPVSARFQCVEHRTWTPVTKESLAGLGQGDIVRVEKAAGQRARLVLVRTAAEELSSPER
jgi:hypothetical protein